MSIIESIREERQKQDKKWGTPQRNRNIEWLAILGEEQGELCEAVLAWHFGAGPSSHSGRMHDELIQVIAVGVAWLEHLGYGFDNEC